MAATFFETPVEIHVICYFLVGESVKPRRPWRCGEIIVSDVASVWFAGVGFRQNTIKCSQIKRPKFWQVIYSMSNGIDTSHCSLCCVCINSVTTQNSCFVTACSSCLMHKSVPGGECVTTQTKCDNMNNGCKAAFTRQTKVGKLKLVCVNGAKTVGKHVLFVANSLPTCLPTVFAPFTHTNSSLPTLVCRVKAA